VKLRRTRCGLDPFAMRPIVSAFRKVSAKADQAHILGGIGKREAGIWLAKTLRFENLNEMQLGEHAPKFTSYAVRCLSLLP
jgi:hypothetical protein